MAIPPKGDPRRPLHLAVRSTSLLGGLFILVGTCVLIPIFVMSVSQKANVLLGAAVFAFFMGPGIAYMVFSIFLKKRKFWAVVASIILASLQLLGVLINFCFAMIQMAASPNTTGPNNFGLIGLIVNLLIVVALGQLVYHLVLSFEAIKHEAPEQQRGFEPLMVRPIEPPAMPDDPNSEYPK